VWFVMIFLFIKMHVLRRFLVAPSAHKSIAAELKLKR
jgi:hypothetical protein